MAISSGCHRIVVQAYLSISSVIRGSNPLLRSTYDVGITSCKQLHSSTQRRGLEEFFPKGEDIIEEAEKTGIVVQEARNELHRNS